MTSPPIPQSLGFSMTEYVPPPHVGHKRKSEEEKARSKQTKRKTAAILVITNYRPDDAQDIMTTSPGQNKSEVLVNKIHTFHRQHNQALISSRYSSIPTSKSGATKELIKAQGKHRVHFLNWFCSLPAKSRPVSCSKWMD